MLSNYLLKLFIVSGDCVLLERTVGPMDILVLAKFLLLELFGLRIAKTLRRTTRVIRGPDVGKDRGEVATPPPPRTAGG